MTIFGLINKNSGPGFHRITMPLLLMDGPNVWITNAANEQAFDERRPDWIYYNRMISDDILQLQSRYHFNIAVDVDDWWHLDPHHVSYKFHSEFNMAEHQVKHLRIADVVTTTHSRLAELIYPYNHNVVILPNSIPNHEYFPVNRTTSNFTRIFWQGSITHEKDIALLRNPIRRLDKKKFMMVMAGYMQQIEWERMATMYTDGLRLPGAVLPGLPVQEYYQNYQYADVCVAPLVESPFNSMKSNLKVLEAAHSGLPVIASCVHPYLDGLPIMPVRRQRDWYEWIMDKEAHVEYASALKAHVAEHYNYTNINNKRKKIFI